MLDVELLDRLVDQGLGHTESPEDPRRFVAEAFLGAPPEVFPDNFEVEVPFVTYQGQIPSCTAHAVTTMKSIQEGVRLSPRFNFAWTKFYDGYQGWGATFDQALRVLQDNGAIEESLYSDKNTLPENEYTNVKNIPTELNERAKIYKSKAFVVADRSKVNAMRTIMQFKTPVLVGLNWYQSYNRVGKDGVLPDMTGSSSGHAVVAIGWRTVNGVWELICLNSFGSLWGDNGRFYVTEDKLMRLYNGVYATIDMTVEEARKIDTEYKKKLNKPMLDLRKLEAQKKTLIFDADSGKFYLNLGDKLQELSLIHISEPTRH